MKLMCYPRSVSCFQAQLIDFSMYHLGEVDITALYPHIQKVALIRSYHDCLVLKEKIRNQPNLKSFFKAPGTVDY
ncbi:hypothetical protein T09_4267 [Trichinella sp. T9]|nr:hypothetical protein T09_4267 [Trichinella sp. T9]